MIASENRTSPLVRLMLASDLGHRYSDELYGGSTHARRIIKSCEELLQQLFHVENVLVTPLSGNFAVLAAVLGLTKPGNAVAKVSGADGGYPLNLEAFQRKGKWLHFDHATRSVDMEASRPIVIDDPPALVMLGQSAITHPHPVAEMRKLIDEQSLKCPLVFDGSHVLGLIAGGEFQAPLQQGADVLLGSTHKTFFGPQGGLLLANDKGLFRKIARYGGFTQGSHALVDNMHLHRVGGLAVAALEMLEFGKQYASQVVKNSQALARALHASGIPVKGSAAGFTRSHQVMLDYSQQDAFKIKGKLESVGLITDVLLRLGTSEISRLGMKEPEMKQIASLISGAIREERRGEDLQKEVEELAAAFQTVQYTVDPSAYPTAKALINSYFAF